MVWLGPPGAREEGWGAAEEAAWDCLGVPQPGAGAPWPEVVASEKRAGAALVRPLLLGGFTCTPPQHDEQGRYDSTITP